MASRVLFLAASLVALAGCAAAETPAREPSAAAGCGDRAAIAEKLAEAFGEHPVGMGLSQTGALVEIFAAPGGGWTLLVSWPSGEACLLGAGEGWETLTPPDRGPGPAPEGGARL